MSAYQEVISKLSNAQILAIVAGYGLASHAYFKNYEPTLFGSFWFAVGSSAAFIATLVTSTSRSGLAIAGLYFLSSTVYLISLFGSIAFYRLYWHPLRNIPGDKWAALWKWNMMGSSWRGQIGYDAKKAHDKYGPVVRIGPNWVDFQNPATIPKIYGASPVQFQKGSWYDQHEAGNEKKFETLQHTKDDALHGARRKIWDRGFSIKALSEYEGDLKHRVQELLDGIAKHAAENPNHEVDMELWSSFFSFDVMGDLGFGEGFKMLETGKPHRVLEILKASMKIGPPFSQVSWIVPLKLILPRSPVEKEFKAFTVGQVDKRITVGAKRRDLFSHLLAEDGDASLRLTKNQLESDAVLTIIAGSDTTSSVLTWAWYYLTSVRGGYYYKKLQEELDAAAEEGELDTTRLSRLPLLNAVINETMRLQPPVPGGMQRIAPKGGVVLDGVFIPGGTTVTCGAYVVQHDPANWSPAPDSFRPERWIDSDKEIAANKNAFIPFSYGPRSCPGKGLAMMESRMVLSAVVPRYNMTLKPGFDCAAFEAGVRDCFTIQSPELPLVLNARQ